MNARRRSLLQAAAAGSMALLAPVVSARESYGGRRLVLVELAGANDGLNTLVPWRDERYRALRPTLALGDNEVHPLGVDGLAVHQALRPLLPMLDHGEIALVQGLGYPSPNRSHFSSIDYWHSGGDGVIGSGSDGWPTHDLEHRLGRAVQDAHGISLDGPIGPLASPSGRWLSADSVAQLVAMQAASPPETMSTTSASIAAMRDRMIRLDGSLARLQRRLERAPAVPAFPGGEFGEQLREVVRFMGAGLDTPLYRVRLGGFDTHQNQRDRHARLLAQLGSGLAAFRDALVARGDWSETLVMTYSEFGRRAAENDSGGTDHGTAAPHLVLGGRLGTHAAPYGRMPDLDDLIDGDPVATLDYRALYDRVLSDWLGIGDNRFTRWRNAALDGLIA